MTGDYAIDLDGTVESRDIDGTVTFSTTQPYGAFTGNEFLGNGDPTAGALLARERSGRFARLKLIARTDGVDVELQVDADG